MKSPPATRHTLRIPGWHPARINTLAGSLRKRHQLKTADRVTIGAAARLLRIPPASGPRRVSLTIGLGPGEQAGDPAAYIESLVDSLIACGLLVDGGRQGVERGQVVFEQGQRGTRIVLEDLP
jgi:hypothetical protein